MKISLSQISITACNSLVSIYFSQVELRVQALYTILVNDPDLNMLRAYSPYKCHRLKQDGTYDFDTVHIAFCIEMLRDYLCFLNYHLNTIKRQ